MKKPTPKLRTLDNYHLNQKWTTRTQRITYEWEDSDGVQHVTAWSKAVRNNAKRGS